MRDEIVKMRELTDKPFGVNIAQLFVRDASIVDFVAENGVTFVTTSAGDPTKFTQALKDAGLTVFHVVPSLRGALKAVDAGVDGLVVEGNEGGGFKAPTGASTMVLLPLIASRVDVPIIAAGGVCDGRSMAAAFVLGAEGVQMGTRMVSAAESPVHDNWKQLICSSNEGDTLLLNRHSPPAFRVLRTGFSESAEGEDRAVIPSLEAVRDLYFGGNMEASFAFSGQVAGRIDRSAAGRADPARDDRRVRNGAARNIGAVRRLIWDHGPMGRTVRYGELLLGIEGAALFRNLLEDGDFAQHRIDAMRELAADFDGKRLSYRIPCPELDVADGYTAWAPTYDSINNVLIQAEEKLVASATRDLPVGTALDAACGTGRHAEWLAAAGHDVTGVDKTPAMLDIARTHTDRDVRDRRPHVTSGRDRQFRLRHLRAGARPPRGSCACDRGDSRVPSDPAVASCSLTLTPPSC